ncbi:MAG: diadenylate cyclase CdaA [bacterium]
MTAYLWNAVDILVVYYMVYRLILLIQGTRAMNVVWGVLILAIITATAKGLGLSAAIWLLQQFWVAGIFLLIIVFQPEIRSALANLGSQPLGRLLVSHEFEFIGELMDAVKYCSESRTGMLVVLEQEMGLRDIVESGITLNAEISKELLLSIFHNKTPLHDGAVVLARSRVVAAACTLPLTQQQELSKILGMRHRAAVGLSEICDALVIMVSEENGTISLARGGHMQRPVIADELEKQLQELYRSKAEKTLLRKSGRQPAAPGGKGKA